MSRLSTLSRALIPAVVMGIVIVGVGPTAVAQAATSISPVTRVTVGEASTSVGFAWHTARTASASTAQPVTRLMWGPSESFSCESADWSQAVAPTTSTVYDRVTYSSVTLDGVLQPGTSYSYCVRAQDGASSPTATFTTPGAADSFTFLAFANANWRSTSTYKNYYANTVSAALAKYPDAEFATHSGATGSATDQTHWEGFTTANADVLNSITWAPTPLASGTGNRYFSYGNALPIKSGTDTDNYAVREGNALILVINTYLTDSSSLSATTRWIADRVNALNAEKDHTWVIASVPTQIYAATSSTSAYATALKKAFHDNGVALVLQGGAEAYTRSWPIGGASGTTVYRDYPSQTAVATSDGTIYMTPGSSGAQQASVPSAATSATSGWLAAWTPTLSSADQLAAAKKSYSAITVTADELSVVAQTAGPAGAEQVLDQFTINRLATPPVQPMLLQPYGLNNSFGTDARTTRTVTWLALDSAKYTLPYIKIATDPAQIAGAEKIADRCSIYALPSAMASYTSYTCQLTGLSAGTTYTYQVGAMVGTRPWESPTYQFTTQGDDADAGFTFLDFADSQSVPSSTYDQYWGNTLRTALANHPEAVLAIQNGDIADENTQAHITGWLGAVGTSLSGVAFGAVMGNHDATEAAQPMWNGIFPRQTLVATPKYSEAAALQYTYVVGNALFIHVNTNLDTSSQLKLTSQWIMDTVDAYGKNSDGSDRFIIVVEHKSPFGGRHAGSGSYPSGDLNNPYIVKELPKTYDQVGVDLVLAGHDHNLIRSLPIQWSTSSGKATWDTSKKGLTAINSDTDGLVYYIPRNSGQKTYDAISTPTASSRPWVAKNWSPSSNATAPENTVYSVVTVTKTEITVKSYRTGDPVNPVDMFTVVQGYPDPTVSASSSTIGLGATDTGLAVTVSTNQPSWTATSDSPWLTVTPSGVNGDSMTVTMQQNAAAGARTASITLTATSATRTVTVTQAGTATPVCP